MGTVSSGAPRLALPRRAFLGVSAAGLGALVVRPAQAALPTRPAAGVRSLSLQNLHTGERLATEYWANGAYHPDALAAINHVLRDHRTGAEHPMKTELLDLLHKLHGRLEVNSPFQIISGYRSPETNAKLAAASSGVAHQSLHMQGMAIDIRVPGVDLRDLRKCAKAMGAGGVGYYAASNFVHIDVGRVRYW